MEGPRPQLATPKEQLQPHVAVTVLNQKLIGFWDSGSNISAIHDQYRKFVTSSAIQTCHLGIRSAQGKFFCTKKADLFVQLGPIKAKHTFLFMKTLPKQILFGLDFMAKYGVNLHPQDNTWSCKGTITPFVAKPINDKCDFSTCCLQAVNYVKNQYPVAFPEYAVQYDQLLDEFQEIFSFTPGIAKCEPMHIDTGAAFPIEDGQRRMSAVKAEIIEQTVQDQLKKGWLEPCDGPWRCNWVVAPKKGDEGYRPCGDYRRLNDVTISDAYPSPDAKENLEYAGQAKVFSIFDLTKGYYQIPIAEADRDKTAIW